MQGEPRFDPWLRNLIPHATTKDPVCHNEDPTQPIKYINKKENSPRVNATGVYFPGVWE